VAWVAVAPELDQHIAELRRRLADAPEEPVSERVDHLRALGAQLMLRYLEHGLVEADRDAALRTFEELIATPGADPKEVAVAHLSAGQLLALRVLPASATGLFRDWGRRVSLGEVPDLRFAEAAGEAATSLGTPEELADLDAVIGHLELASASPALPTEVAHLASGLLGTSLLMRSLHSLGAGADDADRAGEVLEHSAPEWPEGAPGRSELMGLTLLNQAVRARRDGGGPGVDGAIDALTALAAELPSGHVLRPLILNEAGLTMAQRAGRTESIADMAAGPKLLEEALAQLAPAHPLYEEVLNNLGGFTLSSTALDPAPEAADRVVELAREAVELRGPDNPEEAAVPRFLLAMALLLRGTTGGNPADVTAATEHLRFVATRLPVDHRLAPTVLAVLGALLIDRHTAHGGLEDAGAASFYIDRADRLLQARGAEAAVGDDFDLLIVRGMRGLARALHGGRTRDPDMLGQALDDLQLALDRLPQDSPWQARLLAGLGTARLARGVSGGDPDDLRHGAAAYLGAFQAMPATHPHRPLMAAQRALAVFLEGLLGGDEDALDRGLALLEAEVAADPAGLHLERSRLLHGLGMAYLARAGYRDHRAGDLDQGIDHLEQAWRLISEQPGQVAQAVEVLRLLSGAYRRRLDPERNDRRNAVDAGLVALREVVCEVLLQVDAEDGLVVARDAAADAHQLASWCLQDGRPEAAIEAIELGRGLVLHAATSATTVPELLRAAGAPDLAAEWARAPLPAPQRPWRGPPSGGEDGGPGAAPGAAMRLVQELGLLGWEPPSDLRHRALSALKGTTVADRLLLAPGLAELAGALRERGTDALLYLLPGLAGDPGQALLVGADRRLEPVPLPGLWTGPGTPVDVYVDAHHRLVEAVGDPGADRSARAQATRTWREALGRLCNWAWPAAMGPVLDQVATWGLDHPPRLTLVAGGTLGVVPWHAARRPGGPDGALPRYACQQAVLSYAATGRQLAELARRGRVPLHDNPVLVVDPTGDLYWAREEVEAIRAAHYPRAAVLGAARGRAVSLGTPEEVLGCLPGAERSDGPGPAAAPAPNSLLHLGCHARTGKTPTESYLALAPPDGPEAGGRPRAPRFVPLPVGRILRQALARPSGAPGGLVVLSACVTDLTDGDHDEAVTLATALLAAGAAGVIGSRWMVDGVQTSALMFMLHQYLGEGMELSDALRAAQLWMIDPHRRVPAGMPSALAEDAAGVNLAEVQAWAAFTTQGH
jgi:tetratricopeptide (TPR) repeat protein